MIIGDGDAIRQALTKQLFKREAKLIHVLDISENYPVELVRDIRSNYSYITKNLVSTFDYVKSDRFLNSRI